MKRNEERGYAILMGVLVLLAVGTSIGIGLLTWGVMTARGSTAREHGARAASLAHACASEALERLQASSALLGTINVTILGQPCQFTVINRSGSLRQVNAVATYGNATRRAEIQISNVTATPITVTSWLETAAFTP